MPSWKQYGIRASPDDKLYWYPNEERYVGPSSDDLELRSKLYDHTDSLDRLPINARTELSEADHENLADMGYLQ